MGSYQRNIQSERLLEEVLFSDADPVLKVQRLINIGFDEEVANDIVERYQIGQNAPVYYERLPRY